MLRRSNQWASRKLEIIEIQSINHQKPHIYIGTWNSRFQIAWGVDPAAGSCWSQTPATSWSSPSCSPYLNLSVEEMTTINSGTAFWTRKGAQCNHVRANADTEDRKLTVEAPLGSMTEVIKEIEELNDVVQTRRRREIGVGQGRREESREQERVKRWEEELYYFRTMGKGCPPFCTMHPPFLATNRVTALNARQSQCAYL